MLATADSRLIKFNTLALNTQDDAYTLAYYLLGDESCAERATQAAFDYLYQAAGLKFEQFRLEVLSRVLEYCQKNLTTSSRSILRSAVRMVVGNHNPMLTRLLALDSSERPVVILVDVLGLDYDEAAQVMGGTKKQVARLLAHARQKLVHGGINSSIVSV